MPEGKQEAGEGEHVWVGTREELRGGPVELVDCGSVGGEAARGGVGGYVFLGVVEP